MKKLDAGYRCLTADERFRLLLAAGDRNDEDEQSRLVRTAGSISLGMKDHRPLAEAFTAVAHLAFIDLVEDAASFRDLVGATSTEADEERWAAVMAKGYLLRAKASGWTGFCRDLVVPPYALWSDLPGFERMQTTTRLAGRMAFTEEGFVAWLNRGGEGNMTSSPITSRSVTDEYHLLHRRLMRQWGVHPAA